MKSFGSLGGDGKNTGCSSGSAENAGRETAAAQNKPARIVLTNRVSGRLTVIFIE
jgi:hypothetical protein